MDYKDEKSQDIGNFIFHITAEMSTSVNIFFFLFTGTEVRVLFSARQEFNEASNSIKWDVNYTDQCLHIRLHL